ncbi:hypothetical protein V6U79_22355, partial [Micromonospora sp. CPCC 205556]
MTRWDHGAANTWNKHLSALTSFTAYCRRQDWLTTDPGRRLERRKVTRTRDKAIPRSRLERLFTDDRNLLRERVLWRMLYEPAPAPRRSSASTCPTSTWSSAAPWSSRKAVTAPTCTGRPQPHGSCPGCWPAAPPGRCSSPTDAHPPPGAALRP